MLRVFSNEIVACDELTIHHPASMRSAGDTSFKAIDNVFGLPSPLIIVAAVVAAGTTGRGVAGCILYLQNQ